MGFPGGSAVKGSACNARAAGDAGLRGEFVNSKFNIFDRE